MRGANGATARPPTPLRAFHTSLVFVGMGAAFVDTWHTGTTNYYIGFTLLFSGFVAAFLISLGAVLRPATLFMVSILLEAFGWWNVFWSGLMLWQYRTLPPNIALAQYPVIGVISIPLWEFALSTLLAIVIPIALTQRFGKYAPRAPRVVPIPRPQ